MPEKIDSRRKYTLDIEPFFIDSSEKYYWLGFLATDGHVALKEPRIRVELKQDDEDLLLNLAKFCKTNKPLTHRKNNNGVLCSCLDINSAKLKKYLNEYNITPQKTKNFYIPLDKIPQDFIWDFVRGMMDGDGCITIINGKRSNPYAISFVSANKKCVEQMKQLWGLPENHAISKMNGAYIVQKSGLGCLPILNKIYETSTETTRLKRKYERYRSLIQ